MNCRQAKPQIFAERDGALDEVQRAALAEHVAQCAACRRLREGFAANIEAWRASTLDVPVPDAEREWHKLRREIRGGAGSQAAATSARRTPFAWFAVPLATAAAVAIALYVNPGRPVAPGSPAIVPSVAASTADNTSTVVFVDEQSGWTFVVAADSHRG